MDSDNISTTPSLPMIAATAVATTIATLVVGKKYLYPRRDPVILSPLTAVRLGKIPSAVAEDLEHGPDEFPGARDVNTPYGSIRTYEFGPSSGKKILFIHGISTSAMTLTRLANSFVASNHRVLLFDLFGRGFSDTPSDLPHDSRLYLTQILLALASSPLSWMGTNGLAVIGYSMGGALAVSFATTFPHLVESLVLLAPAGLIRSENFGLASRLMFQSGYVPPRLLEAVTRKRLRKPLAGSVKKSNNNGNGSGTGGANAPEVPSSGIKRNPTGPGHVGDEAIAFAEGETLNPPSSSGAPPSSTKISQLPAAQKGSSYPPSSPSPLPSSPYALSSDPLEQAVAKYVHWMLDHHQGFVPAFVGCIASAPLTGQQQLWAKLGDQIRSARPDYFPAGVIVLLGREDQIVDAEDYGEDGKLLLDIGPGRDGDEKVVVDEKLVWQVVGGGHNFPMTNANEALEVIYRKWGVEPPEREDGTTR
ncbi:hypothetical protein MKZ38_008615 [Zalerion maritima]|uniref:AB hydrolase-1 domain-containing protein n=1 Tax=Zalerion maritima TaxID=339359 RepID=A0AAD5RYP4_9PEZI|nr:hypothetical protein MKZ38_008615 [Zalerion maritima]